MVNPKLVASVSTCGVLVSLPVMAVEWKWWHYNGALFAIFSVIAVLSWVAPALLAAAIEAPIRAVGLGELVVGAPRFKLSDGPETVVTQMLLRPEELECQLRGCKALDIMGDKKMKSMEEREGMVKLGALTALNAALVAHPDNDELAAQVLSTLARIADMPLSKAKVSDEGGASVEALIGAMRSALRRDKAAADALTDLAEGKEASGDGGDGGGGGGGAGAKGPSDAGKGKGKGKGAQTSAQRALEVCRLGCISLGALADGHKEVQTIVLDEGFAEVVLEALEWYQLHPGLNQWALWALFNLAYDHQSNKVYMVKKGAVGAVVDAMKRHPGERDLQRQGVAFFFSCLRFEDGIDAARMRQVAHTAGLKGALTAAIAAHPRDEVIKSMAKAMLDVA